MAHLCNQMYSLLLSLTCGKADTFKAGSMLNDKMHTCIFDSFNISPTYQNFNELFGQYVKDKEKPRHC